MPTTNTNHKPEGQTTMAKQTGPEKMTTLQIVAAIEKRGASDLERASIIARSDRHHYNPVDAFGVDLGINFGWALDADHANLSRGINEARERQGQRMRRELDGKDVRDAAAVVYMVEHREYMGGLADAALDAACGVMGAYVEGNRPSNANMRVVRNFLDAAKAEAKPTKPEPFMHRGDLNATAAQNDIATRLASRFDSPYVNVYYKPDLATGNSDWSSVAHDDLGIANQGLDAHDDEPGVIGWLFDLADLNDARKRK